MNRLVALLALLPLSVPAAEIEIALAIRDHRFEPAEVRVPAGQKVKLVVHNQDSSPEEFESFKRSLDRVAPPPPRVAKHPAKAVRNPPTVAQPQPMPQPPTPVADASLAPTVAAEVFVTDNMASADGSR